MATTQLRLKGTTGPHLVTAAISALPIFYIDYQMMARHARPAMLLWTVAAAVALLPWISRAIARATYRAKFDDIAVHVRSEALPYKTIKEAKVVRTARRATLHLIRTDEIRLELVLNDAFAGHLEPLRDLKTKLREHNLEIDYP